MTGVTPPEFSVPAFREGGSGFPRLGRAPIAEAVIEVRASADTEWSEPKVAAVVRSHLSDYVVSRPITLRSLQLAFSFGLDPALRRSSAGSEHSLEEGGPGASATSLQHSADWIGARIESADGLQVATMRRDLFSFSRLRPYQDWDRFSTEALRLWQVYRSIAEPSIVSRLGVRFINRLDVPIENLDFDRYLRGLGSVPADLRSAGFLHRDALADPGDEYRVNLVRTAEPPAGSESRKLAILVDIDAFTARPFAAKFEAITERLVRLRDLKNRVFFETLSEHALRECQ